MSEQEGMQLTTVVVCFCLYSIWDNFSTHRETSKNMGGELREIDGTLSKVPN